MMPLPLLAEREVTVRRVPTVNGLACKASIAGLVTQWQFFVIFDDDGPHLWFAHSTQEGWSRRMRSPEQWSTAHPVPRNRRELHQFVKWFLRPHRPGEPPTV